MKARTVLNVVGALASTLGIIIPVAIYARPRDGYRMPPILEMGGNYSNVPRPPKMQLGLVLRVLGNLEQSGQARLNAAQAKRCMALVERWRQRPRMSDEAAVAVTQKLSDILDGPQRKTLEEALLSYGSYGGYNAAGPYYNFEERLRVESFRQIYNPFFPPTRYKEFTGLTPEAQERFKARFTERQLLLQAWQRRAYPQKVVSRRLVAKESE